jgi:hypothetical protein
MRDGGENSHVAREEWLSRIVYGDSIGDRREEMDQTQPSGRCSMPLLSNDGLELYKILCSLPCTFFDTAV